MTEKQRKVHDLDRTQTWLFTPDNSVNNKQKEIELKSSQKEKQSSEEDKDEKEHKSMFTGPFTKVSEPVNIENEKDGDEGLFIDDDFDTMNEKYGDQHINEEGMMDVRTTRDRLEKQAKDRKEQLKSTRKHEMTKEEFNEKWALPAYLRRGVKMTDVPHSSESFISKYNLNDDNSILGNNKFLHDNVD
jgi:cell division protein FtsZ